MHPHREVVLQDVPLPAVAVQRPHGAQPQRFRTLSEEPRRGDPKPQAHLLSICGLPMSHSPQVLAKPPLNAYVGHDGQSDRESAWVLDPRCLQLDEWDSVAVTLFQHLGPTWVPVNPVSISPNMHLQKSPRCLTFCVSVIWLSAVFSPQLLLENGLTGFFWLLLLEVMAAWQAGGGKWQSQFLARATVRNSLLCCGNMIEWVCRYPDSNGGLAVAPSKCTEQVARVMKLVVPVALGLVPCNPSCPS